jgi:nucleoid DNA-binding protein
MQKYIHKYFALNRSVSLPGIGSFVAETRNAKLDFIDKTLEAPIYAIRFDKNEVADEKFYGFLSRETGVEQSKIVEDLRGFTAHLKEQLEQNRPVGLPGIGTLIKNALGYELVADNSIQNYFPSISAERIIRQNAEHTVKVGEEERTSTQMHEHFQQKKVKEDNWFVHALILGAIGIAAIAIYYLFK